MEQRVKQRRNGRPKKKLGPKSSRLELFKTDVAPLRIVSHNLEMDSRGSAAATAACFLSRLCLLLCVYAPADFSPPVFLQLFSVSARISFSFLFFFFFDKQPAACSLPIHFIHILFPCKNSCLLALGSAPSQHKQLLRIRSDCPTDQKSRRSAGCTSRLSLSGLSGGGGGGAGLTSRSRPAFQPSCSRHANSAPRVAIFFFPARMSHLPVQPWAEPLFVTTTLILFFCFLRPSTRR